MKELITRVEELAVQLAGAQLQIDKSEDEARELGRELGKARQKMMELVNERDHALARVPPESWAKENKRLAAQSEDLLGVIERRELLIKSLNDEITKRDHELRAHEKELAEQREEIRKIRAEVPLESTREALKNAAAKLNTANQENARLRDANDQNTKTIETLSVELSARYAEIAELHKWATGLIENPGFAQNAPERTMHYRDIVERINSRPQLDLTAMLPAVDWQVICTKREDELARLNAKLGPLEKLYQALKKHVDNGAILNRGDLNDAYAEIDKSLSQLTA